MPELADVGGFRRVLAEHAVDRRIRGVEVFDPGVLRGVSAPSLGKRLRGRRFPPPHRHGKWLIVPVSGGRGDESSVLLHFGMTGSLRWVGEGEDHPGRSVGHRRLGNLLADEILGQGINPRRPCVHLGASEIGRLHARMRSVLRQSIRDGRVPPRKSWLTGRRDEPSGSCPRCGTTLRRGRVGGRGTVWCPRCQPE